jgi:hypothetical protein
LHWLEHEFISYGEFAYVQDVTANVGNGPHVLVDKHLPIFILVVKTYNFSIGMFLVAKCPLKLPFHQTHHTKVHGDMSHGHCRTALLEAAAGVIN